MTTPPTLKTLIALGRVSNLPTVWTNCLAALALVAASPPFWAVLASGLAMSLFYTGGMFLNDAFDHEIDRQQRPERPIPSGAIRLGSVYVLGFAQLGAGLLLIVLLDARYGVGRAASWATLLLGMLIVAYNLHHKNNPLSPLLMGLCRVAVYASVGLLFWSDAHSHESPFAAPEVVWLSAGSAALLLYLMVLTAVAKREGRGVAPPVPIPVLIAGISLVDGALMLAAGAYWLALCAPFAFLLTLRLQRWVRGD